MEDTSEHICFHVMLKIACNCIWREGEKTSRDTRREQFHRIRSQAGVKLSAIVKFNLFSCFFVVLF